MCYKRYGFIQMSTKKENFINANICILENKVYGHTFIFNLGVVLCFLTIHLVLSSILLFYLTLILNL